jgi:curved DNA-binding protein CbpA
LRQRQRQSSRDILRPPTTGDSGLIKMGDPSTPLEALSLLGEVYREKRTGVLSLLTSGPPLRASLRGGQVVGLCPPPGEAAPDVVPDPDDSARRKLEQVLVEVGLRRPRQGPGGTSPSVGALRDRLVSGLASGEAPATFREMADLPENALSLAGGTEPLILEAVRRVQDPRAIEALLGDLDRGLQATPGMSRERTLTLTEGALLARVDGVSTAREVLGSAPLETEDARRGLVGLLLTGRVEYRPELLPAARERAQPTPLEPELAPPQPEPAPLEPEPAPLEPEPAPLEPELAPPQPEPESPQPGPIPTDSSSAETEVERQRILGLFQALPHLSQFEVLGLEPGCTDADVRRAYVAQVKRYHPDAQRNPALHDLHDVLETIFVRVSEAWETLGSAERRAAYESRLGVGAAGTQGGTGDDGATGATPDPGDETLQKAEQLLSEARFWDAIQILEAEIPRLQPQGRRHRGEILLARAYARNPKWVRRAERTLQGVVREDSTNAEAHYQLGLLYKAGGLSARAQSMFRKAAELRPGYREVKAEISPPEGPEARRGLLRRFFGS